ncbi:hypothetical protein DL96DRAFT_392710 [Flagelloscypha sp. PMI_526]|nr:hypothetical protein DL96DRAFT_392710 [Flagelloscypha sp. PMI_526]
MKHSSLFFNYRSHVPCLLDTTCQRTHSDTKKEMGAELISFPIPFSFASESDASLAFLASPRLGYRPCFFTFIIVSSSMPSPTISAPATNNLLSNCVKAQWQQFLAWYDARRGEQKKKVNDGQLAEDARREWFRRLEVSALKPEWWNMTKDEEATVCRVLGVGPESLHSHGEEKKKRNSRLVENIFGPAAWTKWHKETTPSKPNASSITLRPTTPAPPPAYVRARSYSQSLPSCANSHSIASYSFSPPYAGAPLYYTPCLLPANLETSFPLTPAEQQDLYARVRSCISETSKTKIDEF